jgi:hypothetical protein
MPTQYPGPTEPTFSASPVPRTQYPLIDNDPHFGRVIRYARPSDWLYGAALAAGGPAAFWFLEWSGPSIRHRRNMMFGYRLAAAVGLVGGFLCFYQRSTYRFYGFLENAREVDMDMREMVAKVKAGEPLYGNSRLSPHMQGVAARQSRYSATFLSVLPWFNFVNHNQHGVDTAKYYRQAERELEAERLSGRQ